MTPITSPKWKRAATGYCKIYCTFRTNRKSVYDFVLGFARTDRAAFYYTSFLLLFHSGPFTKDDYNQGKKGLQDGISNLNDSIGSFDTEDPNFLVVISNI